jgi:hypothetical protein
MLTAEGSTFNASAARAIEPCCATACRKRKELSGSLVVTMAARIVPRFPAAREVSGADGDVTKSDGAGDEARTQ